MGAAEVKVKVCWGGGMRRQMKWRLKGGGCGRGSVGVKYE